MKSLETQTNSAKLQCIICKKKVEDEEQGLECYLCDHWKHIECVRLVDRPSESMYEALTENRSKAILYVCSRCCNQLSVSKHLYKFEMEYECACEEWLVSVLDETHDQLQRVVIHS